MTLGNYADIRRVRGEMSHEIENDVLRFGELLVDVRERLKDRIDRSLDPKACADRQVVAETTDLYSAEQLPGQS